jgi:hypothetical protein
LSPTTASVTSSKLGRPGSVTPFKLGWPSEALTVEQEAVATYRNLASTDPDRYRPELARSLANLGISLYELGRPSETLAVE